jgi:ABC-type molybdate transport system substrate-binding protein
MLRFILSILVAFCAAGVTAGRARTTVPTLAAASDLPFAVVEVAKRFETDTGK